MKAIVRMTSGGTGSAPRATIESQRGATYLKLLYLFSAMKPGSEQKCADRVSWVGGNLGGYGVVMRMAALMAIALDVGHKHLPGRRTRQAILSCEPCGEEGRAEAERKLMMSAPLLAAILGAGRWIAVIHRDKATPHLHLLIANYNPEKDRRLEYTRFLLSEIQNMAWTPHFDSGKGGAQIGGLGTRGKTIRALKMERNREDPADRNCALEKVHGHMAKHRALALDHDAMALWLAGQCAGQGWDGTKLLKKQGDPRKNPTVRVDGINLRMRYIRWFIRDRIKKLPAKALSSKRQKLKSPRISTPEFREGPQ